MTKKWICYNHIVQKTRDKIENTKASLQDKQDKQNKKLVLEFFLNYWCNVLLLWSSSK